MLPWPVWLSCLGIIAKCRVAGLIPSQGTCMCCCLWSGAYRRQLINVSLPLFSLPSSLSENKINKIFYKRVECHSGQKRKQFKKTGASSTKQCYKGGAGGQLTKASLLPRLTCGKEEKEIGPGQREKLLQLWYSLKRSPPHPARSSEDGMRKVGERAGCYAPVLISPYASAPPRKGAIVWLPIILHGPSLVTFKTQNLDHVTSLSKSSKGYTGWLTLASLTWPLLPLSCYSLCYGLQAPSPELPSHGLYTCCILYFP